MRYGKLNGGKLEYAPKTFICEDGRIITDFDTNTVELKNNGYKEVIENIPFYDPATEYIKVSGYIEDDISITINYKIFKIEVDVVEQRVAKLEEENLNTVKVTLELDFRLFEVEWFLQDTIPNPNPTTKNINKLNLKGVKDMRTQYDMMKMIILSGTDYDKADMEYKITRYHQRGVITTAQKEELLSLMESADIINPA